MQRAVGRRRNGLHTDRFHVVAAGADAIRPTSASTSSEGARGQRRARTGSARGAPHRPQNGAQRLERGRPGRTGLFKASETGRSRPGARSYRGERANPRDRADGRDDTCPESFMRISFAASRRSWAQVQDNPESTTLPCAGTAPKLGGDGRCTAQTGHDRLILRTRRTGSARAPTSGASSAYRRQPIESAQRGPERSDSDRSLPHRKRFAADGDVHRILDALAHDPTPDQFSKFVAGIRVARRWQRAWPVPLRS